MKKIFKVLFFCLTFLSVFASCDFLENLGGQTELEADQKKEIYNMAVESGYDGSYEEWLDSIKGESIELSIIDNTLMWKYTSETTWKPLMSLGDLQGKDGTDGKDGINGTNGKDGVDGTNGKDGVTPHIGKNGNWWIGEIDTKVKAEGKGTDGKDGTNGKDGVTPHIGENGNWWIGEVDTKVKAEGKGADGKDGIDGENGRTPEFRVNEGYLQWKYVDEDDSKWVNLYEVETKKEEDTITITYVYEYEIDESAQTWDDIVVPTKFEQITIDKGLIPRPDYISPDGYSHFWVYFDETIEDFSPWNFQLYYAGTDMKLIIMEEELQPRYDYEYFEDGTVSHMIVTYPLSNDGYCYVEDIFYYQSGEIEHKNIYYEKCVQHSVIHASYHHIWAKHWHYNEDGTFNMYTETNNTYNENWKQIESVEISYCEDEKTIIGKTVTTHTWTEDGRATTIKKYNGEGVLIEECSQTYSNGNMIEVITTVYDDEGNFVSKRKIERIYNGDTLLKTIYTDYDETGKEINFNEEIA